MRLLENTRAAQLRMVINTSVCFAYISAHGQPLKSRWVEWTPSIMTPPPLTSHCHLQEKPVGDDDMHVLLLQVHFLFPFLPHSLLIVEKCRTTEMRKESLKKKSATRLLCRGNYCDILAFFCFLNFSQPLYNIVGILPNILFWVPLFLYPWYAYSILPRLVINQLPNGYY
jgi:hypothetical protein